MHKMATKKIKLFDIKKMYKEAFDEVSLYFDAIAEIQRLVSLHPYTNAVFIAKTVLKEMQLSEDWFSEMQHQHKQSIQDSVKGRRK